jgi:hypothetical protein
MLTRDNVLALWRSEEYKKLSRELVMRYGGDPDTYYYPNREYIDLLNVEIDGNMHSVIEVIDFLDSIMVPIKTIAPAHATFYRGDSKLDPGSPCRKENYISVTINIDDAISFIDYEEQGSISFIKLDPNLRGIWTGVEGELLIQHGCYWNTFGASTYNHKNFFNDIVKYKKYDVRISQLPMGHGNPICSSLLPHIAISDKIEPHNTGMQMQHPHNLHHYRDRVKPFYDQYLQETRELNITPNEDDFVSQFEKTDIPVSVRSEIFKELSKRNEATIKSSYNYTVGTRKLSRRKSKKGKEKRLKKYKSKLRSFIEKQKKIKPATKNNKKKILNKKSILKAIVAKNHTKKNRVKILEKIKKYKKHKSSRSKSKQKKTN